MSRTDRPGLTRAELLAADLSREIVEGVLLPGSRLDEHSLAQRFGVSRTPVREALKRLAGLELVEARPRRGVVVVNMPATRIGELFEALAETEAACARLAAEKHSGLELQKIDEMHSRFVGLHDSGSSLDAAAANRDFHESIYVCARNSFLSDYVIGLRKRLAPFMAERFRLYGSALEHTAIVECIRERDGFNAGEAMRRHIMAVGNTWARWAEKESAAVYTSEMPATADQAGPAG
jgi:DNA-binding GntR family transcriptional regulator